MNQPTSFRDVELISACLDSQLSQAEKARLETRLKNDPQLRSLVEEISQVRVLLRKLPARRAPRNFTLTPIMAGVKPPLPRAFPFFRLASTLAALLLFFAYAANLSVPALATIRAAQPAPVFGMGGGGGNSNPSALEAAATVAPQAGNRVGLTPTPQMSFMQVAPTQAAGLEKPAATEVAAEPGIQRKLLQPAQSQPRLIPEMTPIQLPIPAALQFGLLGLAVLSGGAAYFLRARAESSWFKAQALKPGKPGARQIIILILVLLAIIALAVSIYYISTTTFYAPVARMNTLPAALGTGDKGMLAGDKAPVTGGDKGGGASVGGSDFPLIPGLGYNFSNIDDTGQTAFDFPADVFKSRMLVSFIPGLDGAGLDGVPLKVPFYVNRAFSLIPADKNAELQAAFTITLDYGENLGSAVNEDTLALYWWSGEDWRDASETCSPASSYTRMPASNRLSVAVCKMGSFILAAP